MEQTEQMEQMESMDQQVQHEQQVPLSLVDEYRVEFYICSIREVQEREYGREEVYNERPEQME